MRLAAHQHSLLEALQPLEDPQELLGAVVDRARRSARLTLEQRSATHRVRGCSSAVWLVSEMRNGRCYFRADADSPVVRGLVGLLADFFSDARPVEIAVSEVDPLEILNLNRMLTPTRRHGLTAVREAIRGFARSQLVSDEGRAVEPPAPAPAAAPVPTQ